MQIPISVNPPNSSSYDVKPVDFSQLANLPNQYYQGVQNARQQQIQDAFKGGLPKDANGNIDYNAAAQTLFRLGDFGTGSNLLNVGITQGALTNASKDEFGGGTSAAAPGAGTAQQAAPSLGTGSGGPSPNYYSNVGQAESGNRIAPPPNPNSSAADQYQFLQGTWADVAQKHPELGLTPQGRTGTDPASLAQQQKAIRAFTADNGSVLQQNGVPVNDTTLHAAHFFGAQGAVDYLKGMRQNPNAPASSYASPDAVAANPTVFNDANGRPLSAAAAWGKVVGGSGSPQAAAGASGAAPQGVPPIANGGVGGNTQHISPLVPASFPGTDEQYIDAMSQKAKMYAFVKPDLAAVFEKRAQMVSESVNIAQKAQVEAQARNTELTNEQKNFNAYKSQGGTAATAPEMAAEQAGAVGTAQEQAKAFGTKYTNLTDAGSKARIELPQLQLAKTLIDDPNFYSGPAEQQNLVYKRLLGTFGSDPNTPVPQEAFRKIVSGSILSNLSQLKGMGQIRVAEINLAKDASASNSNSPQANRLLVDIASRLQQRSADLADMAQSYGGGKGILNAGFDRQAAQYDKDHPLFNEKEVSNFRNIIDPKAAGPQEGATATNAATGQRIRFQGGKWVPFT